MARSAAFFDLDRTLMAGSSGMAWVKASYDAGLISRSQMLRWARDGLVFRLRGLDRRRRPRRRWSASRRS